ncbi:MAG: ATP-binding cassette domain-containing protein [Vicinamibacterales bacterium]
MALKHIIGLMQLDSGSVLVEGEDVTTMSRRDLSRVRQRIGLLFQNAALFDSISVGENVAFPLRRHSRGGSRDPGTRAAPAGAGPPGRGVRQDAGRPVRRHAQTRRPRPRWRSSPRIVLADEPSAGFGPGHRSEDRRAARRVERSRGDDADRGDPQHPQRARHRRQLVFLHEGRIIAQGSAEALDASARCLVRQFMRSEGAG